MKRVYGRRTAHREQASPSRPPSRSPPCHASDGDAPGPFQFGFRQRLKELDEHFDHHRAQASDPSELTVLPGPSRVQEPEAVSTAAPVLSHPSAADCSRASLSPSPALLQPSSPQDHPPDSPFVRRRMRRAPNSLFSDSEAHAPSRSSSASPIRHAITTPHSRSSPTPPTSGDFPMPSKKEKGKAPARDVLPLVFDAEQPSAPELPTKSRKMRRSASLVRHKTKAPTKKELREAAFEASRIAADRPVEVSRTEKSKYSLSAFFIGLRRDNINITTPTLGTELLSDPIERFSSLTDKSMRVPPSNDVFGIPGGPLGTSACAGTSTQPSPSKNTGVLLPAAADSDDEMPSVTSIIQQKGRGQRLEAFKQAALQRATASDKDSDDDDLLIVKDDMHVIAREEAAQRRQDKAHGSPVKDVVRLRKIKHPSVRPPSVSPHKLSRQDLQELAKPSFARRGKGATGQLTKKQLDRLMLNQHHVEQTKSIKQQEDEFCSKGGILSRDSGGDTTGPSLSQRLGAYAEQGLKAAESTHTVEDEGSVDGSDEEYGPDLQGSASPELIDEDDDEYDVDMDVSQVPKPTNDEEEEAAAPSRRNKSGQRQPCLIVGSDDEVEQSVRRNLPTVQRDSTSSMESQTEDENDKENSVKLMYDRSEDKENKAVVRHEPSSSELSFDPRLGSFANTEDGVPSTLSPALTMDCNDATLAKGDVRSPLKDISRDEDDPFLSPASKSPFTERLLCSATISPPRTSTSTLSLGSPPALRSERIGRINRLSLDSKNDENDPSGFKSLQPSFLERLHSQVNLEPSLTPLNPLQNGGFSQLFSAEDRTSKKSVRGPENNGLALTFDVGLKPALEVSSNLRQKAESIFEKEQEYVVAAAVQQHDKKELLYVNDHGFLTQTRPEGSSPQLYRLTPTQASRSIGTQVHFTQPQPLSARPPLRTLSFTASPEFSPEPQPLRRLRKRSASPLAQKMLGQGSNPEAELNAFSILGKVPKPPSKAQKETRARSEFVAVEAEESDEDEMLGFGGAKKDDDEEENDNDQDKVVEGLVDDAVMDAETEAADLVQEKYREHEEEDDQRLQKLHQDAVEGKFRTKRRDRGVGFEDDTDEDDDEEARRIRQRMHKKRKIEGDTLEALGQNEETRAFYNTYHQDLIDEDDEPGHLREDVTMSAVENDDAQEEGSEEQETVTVDEIRQRVREIAQTHTEGMAVLDPEDTSWIDRSMMMDADDAVRVKVVEHRRSKSTAHHANAGPMDFEIERSKQHEGSDQQRQQWKTWAKDQGRQPQGTGRSGNSAAVTGHARAKTSGPPRPTQLSNAKAGGAAHRTKTLSMLSTVSSRSDKFA